MPTAKTELEWPYEPADFFEAAYHCKTDDYMLVANAGIVRVTLSAPSDPIDAELQSRITRHVRGIFLARKLLVHGAFKLESERVYQHGSDGKRSISVALEGAEFLCVGNQADIVIHNASGAVVKDTRAERIIQHTNFINSIIPKLANSPTLNALLESYNAAVSDRANELVHLYEIRDAVSKHYGESDTARKKLGFTKKVWCHFGDLANKLPLKQGRHRGRHSKLRNATAAELNEARTIARQIIAAFANQV